ncbi:MAG: DUF1326 domain-containing protein [Candidatus Latescibacteria bacterium]|nr:DUF1326 domain-containing protein [Candidatus Latescibacterota bacterium]
MADKIPWHINGTWIEACNCDFGCPCNFDGFPTRGNCEGTVAFNVDSGRHGDTALDGLTAVVAVRWPKAIHDGNGKAAVFIDQRATDAQRQALVRILTAQDGGMPWEILATTLSEIVGPHFVPISLDVQGTRSRFAVDGVEVQLEPFKNPVTGDEADVHTVLPKGFIFRDGHVCKSAKNVASTGGLNFDWTGKNAYYAKIEWSNQ